MELKPEDFDAVGDGTANDTEAFQKMAAQIEKDGGGTVILCHGAIYMVGRQSPPDPLPLTDELLNGSLDVLRIPHKIFEVKGCENPVILHGNGATIKCRPKMFYGAFEVNGVDPIPPDPFDPTQFGDTPITEANHALRYLQLILFQDCASVSIDNLILDGNEASAIAGGMVVSPTSWELADHGLQLLNVGEFRLVNLESKGNFTDGLMVRGNAIGASVVSRGTPSSMINVHLHGNGRQGFSYLAGVDLVASGCKFNENGRTELGPRAAPGAGVDIEPELTRGAAVRRGTFISCEFLDNAASGLAAGSVNSVDDIRFIDCEFAGYSGQALKLGASGLVFDQCKILGSTGNTDGARFRDCTFEDRDHPTFGASNRLELSLVRGAGNDTRFSDCKFVANQILALEGLNKIGQSEFRNCEVLFRNAAGLPSSQVAALRSVVFEDTAFRDEFAPNLRLQTTVSFVDSDNPISTVEIDLRNLRRSLFGSIFGFKGDWNADTEFRVYETVKGPDGGLYESRKGAYEEGKGNVGNDPTTVFRVWHPLLKEGDFMLVRLFVPGFAGDIKPPNGNWKKILDTGVGDAARAVLFGKFAHTADDGSGEPLDDLGDTLKFELQSFNGLPLPTNGEAQFIAFFGVDSKKPLAADAKEGTAGNTATATAPGFTLTVPGATLVWFGAAHDGFGPANQEGSEGKGFSRFSLPGVDWREQSNGRRTGTRTLYRVKAGKIDDQTAVAGAKDGQGSSQQVVNAQMIALSPPHSRAFDGDMTAQSSTLSASLAFTAEDVGRQIAVVGAAEPKAPVLSSVIVSVTNASKVELADAATNTVAGAEVNVVRYSNEHHVALLDPQPEVAGRGVKTEGPSVRWGKNGPTEIQISGFESGSVVLGRKTLPTNTTKGFTYLPTIVGPPTATPDAQGNTAPIVYDTLGNSLWIYHGAWCRVPCQDPAKFEPTELVGCQHWYRADRGAHVVGGALASWANQGLAAGATFSQSSTSLRPTVIADPQTGAASILFDGTDDFLESNLPAGDWRLLHNGHANDGVTVFIVFRSAAEVQNQVLLQTSRNSSRARTGASYRYRTDPQQAGLIAFEVNDGVSQTRVIEANTGFASVPLSRVHSLATRFRSGLFDLYVDLVQSLSGSPTGSATGAPFGTARISSLSPPGTAAQFIDGHFFELIVYDRFLDDSELATVHSYLNARYKITN